MSEPMPSSDSRSRRRSSIRPAPPDWRPTHAHLKPASPMVVVYSGDGDRAASDWEAGAHSPRSPAAEARDAGPFLAARGFHRDTLPDTTLFDSRPPGNGPEPSSESQRPKRPESRTDPRHLRADPSLFELPPELSQVAPEASEPSSLRAEAEPSGERQVSQPPAVVLEVRELSPRAPPPVNALEAPAKRAVADAPSDARTRPTVRLPRPRTASAWPPPSATETPMPLAPRSLGSAKSLAVPGALATAPAEAARAPGIPRSFLAGLLVLAGCLALFLVLRARSREVLERVPLVAVIEPSRSGLVAAVKPANAGPTPNDMPSTKLSPEPAPAAAPSLPPEAPLAPALHRVVLEVVPVDSKVLVRGNPRQGPPFTFDIGAGGSVVVEVVRAGYVARRVVLDGRKPAVTVGLLRRKAPVAARPRQPRAAPESRSAIVRSGL